MEKAYEKIKMFFSKYSSIVNVVILGLFCYLFLFHNLGLYPLVDIDETRYVNMSRDMFIMKDYVTPYLNFEPFLEKPPLYFWLNVVCYHIFGDTSVFVSRFSNALLAAFSVFFTYFFAAKAMRSKSYGLISAFVLLSSVWFLLLSHIAILDMGFMAFSMAAIYSAILTQFCKEENKKYGWWAAYLFMAFSVLAKGLIGIIIPAMVVFLTFLATRKVKELFQPANIIPGIIIFLLVSLPWHILIYKANGVAWFNDYIVKHHFARFLDSSMGLGRKQPFLFYVPIILAGIMPWTISFLVQIFRGIKSALKNYKATKSIKVIFTSDTNDKKIILFAVIYALSTLVFFSVSSSKLPTYALTLFPALALIIGYFWWGYVCFDKYTKNIKVSSLITFIILILAGIIGAFMTYFPPKGLEAYMAIFQPFSAITCGWFIVVPLIGCLCMIAKNRSLLFVSKVIFMLGVMMITTVHLFPAIMSFGQNELEEFSKIAAAGPNGTKLVSFGFAKKYSLMNDFERKITYITGTTSSDINDLRSATACKNCLIYLIIKNDSKDSLNSQGVIKGFEVVKTMPKYTLLIKNKNF